MNQSLGALVGIVSTVLLAALITSNGTQVVSGTVAEEVSLLREELAGLRRGVLLDRRISLEDARLSDLRGRIRSVDRQIQNAEFQRDHNADRLDSLQQSKALGKPVQHHDALVSIHREKILEYEEELKTLDEKRSVLASELDGEMAYLGKYRRMLDDLLE